jgi:hypothetical protein
MADMLEAASDKSTGDSTGDRETGPDDGAEEIEDATASGATMPRRLPAGTLTASDVGHISAT